MARTPVTFQAAFDAFCRRLNYTPAQILANATLQASALQDFNETYQIGLEAPSPNQWEDARTGADITPVDGFIDWSVIGDAACFSLWTADPRFQTEARELFAPRDWTSDLNGIQLRDITATSVWVSWQPAVAEFTTEAWVDEPATSYAVGDRVLYTNGHNYRCIGAHITSDYADFNAALVAGKWVLLPVLAVLKQFLIDHGQGTCQIRNGNPQTGFAMQGAAIKALNKKSFDELQQQSQQYDRNVCVAYPSSAGGSGANVFPADGRYFKRGIIEVADADDDGVLTFTTPFDAAFTVQVQLTMELPATDGTLAATSTLVFPVLRGRPTFELFRWKLSGPVGDANHRIHWEAKAA